MLFEKIVVRALRTISFLMFVVMIVVVFAQVILRYFFGMPLAWSDELPREIVDAVLNVLLIVGFAAIFKASLEYTVTNHRFVSAVLHYPNSVKYAVVPLSMALMVIKSLERTILDFKKLMKNG